jgi:hypothetical protein
MLEDIGFEDSEKGENVLGLLGYYEAILERDGLSSRIGEIRSLKLGLTLDLLKMVNIAEDLKSGLLTSVLSGWEMNSRQMPGQGEEEMRSMHSCIAAVREKALTMLISSRPINSMQLDIAMMLALPLMPQDLKEDEAPRIRDMLNEVMEDFAARREQGAMPCL